MTKATDEAGYRVVIANAGDTSASNVGLVEALRPGVRYISSRPGAPICIEDAGVVFCTLGLVRAGDSVEVDIAVNTDGTDPTSGRTIVTSDGVQLVVIDEPYLLKIGEPPIAGPGTIVTYTLRIVNPTDENARQVQVQDTMPAALEIVSAQASAGSVSVQGQQVLFTQGQLDAGARTVVTVTARVRQGEGFNEIVNRACLTSQSNRVPSCAEMRFLRASEIPATGERPANRWFMIAALVVAMSLPIYVIQRRKWLTRQH